MTTLAHIAVYQVSCRHHAAVLSAWPDDLHVSSFGPRMARTSCGIVGDDAQPDRQEQRPRESLTGVQWRRLARRL
jgi:hypothetical protein